jgi:hypothetical protein
MIQAIHRISCLYFDENTYIKKVSCLVGLLTVKLGVRISILIVP